MSEQVYDDKVAPLLRQVAEICMQHKMTLIARVEWERDKAGITQIVPDDAGIGQKLTQLAAHSHGNIDALCLSAVRHFDCSASAVLAPLTREQK
ncbi:MAG: hypothetical protein CL802_13660 [Citromicrobium sp.]|nr:hypothetical protein [Citromicrobium sp.]